MINISYYYEYNWIDKRQYLPYNEYIVCIHLEDIKYTKVTLKQPEDTLKHPEGTPKHSKDTLEHQADINSIEMNNVRKISLIIKLFVLKKFPSFKYRL